MSIRNSIQGIGGSASPPVRGPIRAQIRPEKPVPLINVPLTLFGKELTIDGKVLTLRRTI